MMLPFVLTLSLFCAVAAALVNFTVDDNDSLITYKGTWESASAHLSGLDFGGGHTVSTDSGASAVFTFTGVAIYYLAPRWPYAVTTQLSLDGAPGIVVNLTDPDASPTADGSESAPSSVVWAATGLLDATHTLVATMANGGQFIIVDALMCVSDSAPHP
ncbi:hypothetical protein GGX14DRAFT_369862 [Mycena pura]|uniref:Uncharacterized protein n=1 Tax=Mycena pura TaxID=153505 RepID=A0AAD6V8U4_9AGAR|nr:hypothetical protein GGX14DRAFT_369862 [Mycena pura]